MLWLLFFFSTQLQTDEIDSYNVNSEIEVDYHPHEDRGELKSEMVIIPSETVILSQGQTLRLLALDLFGNREFWVYIYQVNKEVIPDPNNVSTGLELKVPDTIQYKINCNDSASVAKAKLVGDKLLQSI